MPNDANALEPVLKKAKQNGILILTNESVGQPSADWDIEIIDNAQFAADYVEEVAKAINGKGGYVIYVGGLTVPQHNLWSDLFIQYQKKHYPDMYEVTSRMPVAENIDDARRTTIDLIKAHPDLKAVISFGSQGPIGAGLAVKEKRLKGKLNVFGMMIPSQAASLIKSGNITMGITYDPASAGYALVTVAAKLLNKGISIIFVSHKLAEVMKVSDNILVLKDGNIVGKYPITEVDEKKLGFLMTGLEITPKKLAEINFSNQPTVLEVKNLSLTSQYKNINFSLKKGEIIALTGLLGSGRTELCLSLFGITQPTTGEILINGKKIKLKNNRHAIKNGIAYVSEDRLNTGLIMEESIHNNIISTIFDKISNKINLINQTRAYQKSNQLIQSLKIKLSNSDLLVNTLSGGNAQRVSIAKWLATSPQIIILDSPTIGVDIANKEEIFNIIRTMIHGVFLLFLLLMKLKKHITIATEY
ncbi:substrate-binding domain-containing protein [Pasteurella multocida]|uniref:substrate-binding domain-containing protein n=1 Tax=Pasteurella multocida TaxID=747 RepID=UPI0020208F47|nr:substrate-binding domain-containing protein [Pasteurella multocida]